MIALHINIDHVATVRQARQIREPDPVIALKQQELQQRAMNDQQRLQYDQQRLGFDQQKLQQKDEIDRARIDS